jgi:drug/metabolite transporter (DMT)-like permease
MNYIWPLLIIVFSNTLYQICAKGIPVQMNTYASMTITYAVATLFSALAVILIFVGLIGYHEVISWSKVLGVAICLVGLYFINRK